MNRMSRTGSLLVLLFLPASAAAQTVSGRVVEEGSGPAVSGAFVELLDSAGERVTAGLSGDGGAFTLRASRPGTYRVRASRIGYRGVLTDPVTVSADEVVSLIVEAPGAAIPIEGVHVEMSGRCVLRPEEGESTWSLWAEARKALEIAEWTAAEDRVRYEVIVFERAMEAQTMVVDTERVQILGIVDEQPFVSEPPDSLAALGYVRREGRLIHYFGLDAPALLSDSFLDAHCFRRVPGGTALVGLAFQPIDPGASSDIRGTLWLDRETHELRLLEFRYVRPPLPVYVEVEDYGGWVEFRRLPDGAWVVGRWKIRSPLFSYSRRRVRHAGFSEREGALDGLIGSDGERIPVDRVAARLVGAVRHPAGAPLADAEVRLVGTPYRVRTDERGRFGIDGLPEGRYRIEATHHRLPRGRDRRVIELSRGATTRVELGG